MAGIKTLSEQKIYEKELMENRFTLPPQFFRLMWDQKLNSTKFVTLYLLLFWSNKGQVSICFSLKEISLLVGVSAKTMLRTLRFLDQYSYVERKKIKDGKWSLTIDPFHEYWKCGLSDVQSSYVAERRIKNIDDFFNRKGFALSRKAFTDDFYKLSVKSKALFVLLYFASGGYGCEIESTPYVLSQCLGNFSSVFAKDIVPVLEELEIFNSISWSVASNDDGGKRVIVKVGKYPMLFSKRLSVEEKEIMLKGFDELSRLRREAIDPKLRKISDKYNHENKRRKSVRKAMLDLPVTGLKTIDNLRIATEFCRLYIDGQFEHSPDAERLFTEISNQNKVVTEQHIAKIFGLLEDVENDFAIKMFEKLSKYEDGKVRPIDPFKTD